MRIRVPQATIWRWLLLFCISTYTIVCVALFFAYVEGSFTGANHLRIGADSATYLAAAGVIHDSSISTAGGAQLVSFAGNFLGPVLIARIIPNLFGIALFNLALFVVCLVIANSMPGVRLGRFFWVIVLNPLTTPSLLTLNKEILSMVGVLLLMKYLSQSERSSLLLLLCLWISMMARWEQAAVAILFLALESRWSPLRGRHWLSILLFVAGITILYPLLVRTAIVNIALLIGAAAEGNFMPRLNELQANFAFPLIVVPKILLNTWGNMLRPSYFWTDYLKGDFSDLQNFFAIPFHCVAMFILSIVVAFKGKLKLAKLSVYWMSMYLVATAATPIFQPRYQYPVYVILCLEFSGFLSPESDRIRRVSKRASNVVTAAISTLC